MVIQQDTCTENDTRRAHFAQSARRAAIDTLFDGAWVTLYRLGKGDEEAWFSALIAPDKVADALRDMGWDLHWGRMRPAIVTVRQGDTVSIRYERDADDGVEPIVLARERGRGPFHLELAEDIRLYLDLFPGDGASLISANTSGDDDVVAEITSYEVRIRKGPLLRYLQARQMHLAIYFDHIVRLDDVHGNPLPEDEQELLVQTEDRVWAFGSNDGHGDPLSRLFGKRLLAPPPRDIDLSGDDEDRHASFIIGEDAFGRPREYDADPEGLANYFGKNPEAPHYLTPVHFRREVLDRYFHNPARYEVADGVVRRDPHWLLKIDDDHTDRVVVFLGDLGRDLPYAEQLHWRAHNVPPLGGLSSTARARSFDAAPADGQQSEHRFKAAYQQMTQRWEAAKGWPLLRPLAPGDRHLLTKLHVPTSDNPAELDAQLLGLAKLLVDSLNDAALDAALGDKRLDERSLAKLERYLDGAAYRHVKRDIATLRAIQGLRSAGAAHARGSNYDKTLARLGLAQTSAPAIITKLLDAATQMLEALAEFGEAP
ncbi:MAG: hypothetical protein KF730_17285 [Sphingomonas sp.]|uniref:hypothetical protein n=1 Tax=Sphingomonas sp. TaxID=28214 RepID=UPI0025D0F4FF|nr:hypothetical protein [Sphingomonas sp.]MBX3566316.1 hypothetical protein [Sphingomonas sp.]